MENEILKNAGIEVVETAPEQAAVETKEEVTQEAAAPEVIEVPEEATEAPAEPEQAAEPAEEPAAEAEEPAEEAPAPAPTRRAPQKIELSSAIIDDGNDMIEAAMPDAQQNAEIVRMRQDIRRKNVCYAAVKGVEVFGDQVKLILKRDTIRIVIPAEDFFAYSDLRDIEQASAEEKFLRYRRKASHYFKGVVSFLPLDLGFDEESGAPFVVASRKQAMERLQNRHFFGRTADVKVGSIAKASIVSSGPRYAIVECLGIESLIGSGALSAFSYIEDVSEEYKPGMGLMVAVESLNVDRANRKIDISLSHALIERSEAKVETVSERMINGRYGATVVAVTDRFYFVIIDGMKIRGIVPKDNYYGTGELVRDDSVAFLVTGINKERNMLIGRCIKSN